MIEPILSHENLRHVITWINNGPWPRPAVARVPDQRGTRRESLKIGIGLIKYLTKIFVFKLERPKISGKNNSDKKI